MPNPFIADQTTFKPAYPTAHTELYLATEQEDTIHFRPPRPKSVGRAQSLHFDRDLENSVSGASLLSGRALSVEVGPVSGKSLKSLS